MNYRLMTISDYEAIYNLWINTPGMGLNSVMIQFTETNPQPRWSVLLKFRKRKFNLRIHQEDVMSEEEIITYTAWKSIGWAILHGLFSWAYVIYYVIKY